MDTQTSQARHLARSNQEPRHAGIREQACSEADSACVQDTAKRPRQRTALVSTADTDGSRLPRPMHIWNHTTGMP